MLFSEKKIAAGRAWCLPRVRDGRGEEKEEMRIVERREGGGGCIRKTNYPQLSQGACENVRRVEWAYRGRGQKSTGDTT